MVIRENAKPCQTSEMVLFPQIATGFRGKLGTFPLSNIKIVKNEKPFTNFGKTSTWIFDKILNMPLNWLAKLRMFHF